MFARSPLSNGDEVEMEMIIRCDLRGLRSYMIEQEALEGMGDGICGG